jgi:maleate isomerase
VIDFSQEKSRQMKEAVCKTISGSGDAPQDRRTAMKYDSDRRRIGMIMPSINIRLEPEYYRCPELSAFNFYTTRIKLGKVTEEGLLNMEQDVAYAAEMIRDVYPEAIIFGCTSGSLVRGAEGEKELCNTISGICGCPVITASRAVLDALDALGAKTITLVTPYLDTINQKEKEFLENEGYTVCGMKGLGITDPEEMRTQPVEVIDQMIAEADSDEADVIFISCTNVEGFHICQILEQKYHKPVISSNLCCLWDTLRILEAPVKIDDLGILMREHL